MLIYCGECGQQITWSQGWWYAGNTIDCKAPGSSHWPGDKNDVGEAWENTGPEQKGISNCSDAEPTT